MVNSAAEIMRSSQMSHLDEIRLESFAENLFQIAVGWGEQWGRCDDGLWGQPWGDTRRSKEWPDIKTWLRATMIRDAIRRGYCMMFILDHDIYKSVGATSLFYSSVSDIRINYRALLNEFVFPPSSRLLIGL